MKRTFLPVLALMTLIGVLLAGCSSESAAGPACPTFQTTTVDPIIYASDNLYAVSEDGARFTRLTNLEKNQLISNPRWSPDRTIIAYTFTKLADSAGDTFRIEAQKLCGFNLATGRAEELSAELPAGQVLSSASWSADNRHLVGFLEKKDEPLAAVKYAVDNGGVEPINPGAEPGSLLTQVAASARTTALAYVVVQTNDQHQASSRLVIDPADGGEQQVLDLSANGLELVAAPRWSPDGKALVLVSQAQAPRSSQAQGGIVTVSFNQHLQSTGVWIYDIGTGQLRQVIASIDSTQIDWSPDGQRLIYSDGQKGGIFTFNLATNAVTRLTERGKHGEIAWGS